MVRDEVTDPAANKDVSRLSERLNHCLPERMTLTFRG